MASLAAELNNTMKGTSLAYLPPTRIEPQTRAYVDVLLSYDGVLYELHVRLGKDSSGNPALRFWAWVLVPGFEGFCNELPWVYGRSSPGPPTKTMSKPPTVLSSGEVPPHMCI